MLNASTQFKEIERRVAAAGVVAVELLDLHKEEVKLGPGEHTMADGHVHNPRPGREADPSV